MALGARPPSTTSSSGPSSGSSPGATAATMMLIFLVVRVRRGQARGSLAAPRRGHRARAARDLIRPEARRSVLAIDGTPLLGPRTGDRRGRRRAAPGPRDGAPTSMSPPTPSPGAVVTTCRPPCPPVSAPPRPGSPHVARQAWLRVRASAHRALDRTGRRRAHDQLRRPTDPGAVDRDGTTTSDSSGSPSSAPPTRSSTRRCSSVPSPGRVDPRDE